MVKQYQLPLLPPSPGAAGSHVGMEPALRFTAASPHLAAAPGSVLRHVAAEQAQRDAERERRRRGHHGDHRRPHRSRCRAIHRERGQLSKAKAARAPRGVRRIVLSLSFWGRVPRVRRCSSRLPGHCAAAHGSSLAALWTRKAA